MNVLVWAPKVILGGAFLFAGYLYVSKKPQWLRKTIIVIGASRILYAILATVGQYWIWSQNAFTRLLLPPHESIRYFIFYAIGRFWINVALVLGMSYLFYLFLRALKKHNERFFEEGEVELGCLIALIVGWPGFVLFVPFLFLAVVAVSIFKILFTQEKFTTLGVPFFVAALPVLLWCVPLIDFFHFGALKI